MPAIDRSSPDQVLTGDDVRDLGDSSSTVYKADTAFLNELIRSKQPPVYRDPGSGEEKQKGRLVGGIPETTPDRDKPSITLRKADTGEQASSDNADHLFSQQSISKTVAHGQAIELVGGDPAFRGFVGTEASAEPYNSLKTMKGGKAFNPHVNSGAIRTQLLSHVKSGGTSLKDYKELLHKLTGNSSIDFKPGMANGEFNEGPGGSGVSTNRLMMETMVEAGSVLDHMTGDKDLTPAERKIAGEIAFLNYCYACSAQVNTKDLATMAGTFENKGVRADEDGTRERVFDPKTAEAVVRTNVVSGSYDEAGTQYVKGHAAVKTGVEGGIMGSVEMADGRRVAVGTYHPDLNAAGNSGAGQKYLFGLAQTRVAFPSDGAAHREVGTEVREVRPGEFGESPREMNERLSAGMDPKVADALRAVSLDRQQAASEASGDEQRQNGGAFYLKDAAKHDAKHKLNIDETPILSTRNQDGSRSTYSFAEASHMLSKIRVRTEAPPAPAGGAPQEERSALDDASSGSVYQTPIDEMPPEEFPAPPPALADDALHMPEAWPGDE